MANPTKIWRHFKIQIWPSILLSSILWVVLLLPWINGIDVTTAMPTRNITVNDRCCNGILGYATNNADFTIVCSEMICCNNSETVAVVPVDVALGFSFRCMPRSEVRHLCYQAGGEVRTSNQDPDHAPRVCCEDAKFDILLNQWDAAMVVKCVAR
ncbi:uncharacterized protein [Haliotis asinina]|uniref:uncharacterized protein n=1 Tax=Haliotis asinina TaxID=109174 RepID=UPI00353278B1